MSKTLENDPFGRDGDRGLESGFTLIELMVVVTIIAILAAIGLPALNKFVRKAETTDATTVLGALDQGIKGYVSTRTTGGSLSAVQVSGANLETVLAGYWAKPADTKFTYEVTSVASDASAVATFCLKATSLSQAGAGSGFTIWWSNPPISTAGWDGKANILNYVNQVSTVTTCS